MNILNNQVMFVRYVPYSGNIDDVKGATPGQARLNMYTAYRVIDINSYSDDMEAYLGIINSYGQIFYLSNRYFKVFEIDSTFTLYFNFIDYCSANNLGTPKEVREHFSKEDGCPVEMYKQENPDHLYFQKN